MRIVDDRRGKATETEVRDALRDLDQRPAWIAAVEWPGDLSDLDTAGLYSWRVDDEGAAVLSEGLEGVVEPGRIYAGQAGATRWPSGRVGAATLRSRIGSQHLGGRIRGSTFRLTLAGALQSSLSLTVEQPRKLAPESEARLSDWMRSRLEVAVHPFPERDALADLEARVLDALDPPLNLEGRPATPLRRSLAELRASVGRPGSSVEPVDPPAALGPTLRDDGNRVTLHGEIEAILLERRGGWMTTQEIAEAVNRRGRYAKRDGSAMQAFQIHGRTKNYPDIFERDGGRVRLRARND